MVIAPQHRTTLQQPLSVHDHPTPLRLVDTRPIETLIHPLYAQCTARERLVAWKPTSKRTFRDTTGRTIDMPEEYIEKIQQVLTHGYAESTLETYASGLLSYDVFCDSRSIPEDQRAPCRSDLLSSWMATMAGTYAGTSIRNYVHGVRAWHIIHGIQWSIDKATLDTMVQGAERLQPERARRKKRLPYTLDYIT